MGKIFTIDCDASHLLLLLFGSRDFGFVSHSSRGSHAAYELFIFELLADEQQPQNVIEPRR